MMERENANKGMTEMELATSLLNIIVYESVVLRNECPDCRSKLSQRGVTLECTHCDASFLCSALEVRRV
jgi:hypothetical protein